MNPAKKIRLLGVVLPQQYVHKYHGKYEKKTFIRNCQKIEDFYNSLPDDEKINFKELAISEHTQEIAFCMAGMEFTHESHKNDLKKFLKNHRYFEEYSLFEAIAEKNGYSIELMVFQGVYFIEELKNLNFTIHSRKYWNTISPKIAKEIPKEKYKSEKAFVWFELKSMFVFIEVSEEKNLSTKNFINFGEGKEVFTDSEKLSKIYKITFKNFY